MRNVVISDTSILIVFQKINEFELLHKVYGEIFTTPEVASEFGEELPSWVLIRSVQDKKYQNLLSTQIDLGEASAIALASEFDDVLILLDDLKARKIATRLNFKISGTMGVLHKAKQLSLIDRIRPIIDKLLLLDFRISESIIDEILKLNNEY